MNLKINYETRNALEKNAPRVFFGSIFTGVSAFITDMAYHSIDSSAKAVSFISQKIVSGDSNLLTLTQNALRDSQAVDLVYHMKDNSVQAATMIIDHLWGQQGADSWHMPQSKKCSKTTTYIMEQAILAKQE